MKRVMGTLIEPDKPAPKVPKRIWDNYMELYEVQKSDKIKFVIAAATRDGFRYINIREFYMRARDGVWKPGRDGITIPIVAPIEKGAKMLYPVEEMLTFISATADYVKLMELADPEHEVWYPPKDQEVTE
jgi:hypothetical protein